jgi:transposase
MRRFKDYGQSQRFLLPPSTDELIGAEDLVRVVNDIIEALELSELKERFTGGGCPAYHPVMMLKVLVYAYIQRVYSSREISKLLRRDVHFMWLAAQQKPDFRTVNRFRGEYLKEIMPKIFAEVVLLLIERKYVLGNEFFVDGTKIEADANRHKITWRKNVNRYKKRVQERVSEILREIDELNDNEDREYDDKDLPEYGTPGAITSKDIKDTVEKIQDKISKKKTKELAGLGQRLERYETQEQTLGGRNSFSNTDPDATGMRMKDDTLKPGYNLQISTERGFVTGYSLHHNSHDGKTLAEHVKSLVHLPKRMIGDSAYGTEENYRLLQKLKIENFLKYQSFHRDLKGGHSAFAKERFEYDANKDWYVCPEGKLLRFVNEEVEGASTFRHYRGGRCCANCKVRSLCTTSAKARTIRRSERLERYKKQAFCKLTSPLGVVLRKRRANEVEGPFGVLKRNQHYLRVRLRGLAKATTDLGLVLLGMNFTKIFLSGLTVTA